ncbi:MAG: hypothetical protein DHS80DRAFT_31138 [Piptocephalis tieghemiana]|nr:MAG: hypothetical protein DHS80DRAFT_31138 [Piptocephalis tieghemiana]
MAHPHSQANRGPWSCKRLIFSSGKFSSHFLFLTLACLTILVISAHADPTVTATTTTTATTTLSASTSPMPGTESTSPPVLQRAALSILALFWSLLWGILLAVWTVVAFFTRPFTRFTGFILRIAVYEPSSLILSLSWAAIPIASFFILAALLGVAAGSGAAWITGPAPGTLVKTSSAPSVPKVKVHKPSTTTSSSSSTAHPPPSSFSSSSSSSRSSMSSSARDQEMLREVEERVRARKAAAAAVMASSIEEEVDRATELRDHRSTRRATPSVRRDHRRQASEEGLPLPSSSPSIHLDTEWEEFDSALEEAESFFSRIGNQEDSSSLDAASL